MSLLNRLWIIHLQIFIKLYWILDLLEFFIVAEPHVVPKNVIGYSILGCPRELKHFSTLNIYSFQEDNKSDTIQLYVRLMNNLLDCGGTCLVLASSWDIFSSPIQNQGGLCPSNLGLWEMMSSNIPVVLPIIIVRWRFYVQSTVKTIG